MFFRKKKEEKKVNRVKKESRLKIDRDEDVQEGEIIETEWDIKKLAIGLVILILLIIVGSYIFFPSKESDNQSLEASMHNLSPTPPLPNQKDVENVIDNARKTLSELTAKNLTSSEAAIQKVINDLEGLKGKNGAMNLFCNTICKK